MTHIFFCRTCTRAFVEHGVMEDIEDWIDGWFTNEAENTGFVAFFRTRRSAKMMEEEKMPEDLAALAREKLASLVEYMDSVLYVRT